jgi:hypothetical protein
MVQIEFYQVWLLAMVGWAVGATTGSVATWLAIHLRSNPLGKRWQPTFFVEEVWRHPKVNDKRFFRVTAGNPQAGPKEILQAPGLPRIDDVSVVSLTCTHAGRRGVWDVEAVYSDAAKAMGSCQ